MAWGQGGATDQGRALSKWQRSLQGRQQMMESQASRTQQNIAGEQWDWQRKIYGEQAAAAKEAAGGLAGMVEQYNTAYGEARAANEARYQQMLGIADQTTGQRAADVRSDYGQQESSMMQGLARQGMAGTTVGATMKTGIQREKQSSLNRLADQMQGTKLGIIERREDEYPQSDILLQLAQALGQGGGGAGIWSALSNMRTG